MPLNEEATDFLLPSPTLGQDLYKQFVEDRLKSGKIPVYDPIKRLKIKSFKTAAHEPRTTQKKSVQKLSRAETFANFANFAQIRESLRRVKFYID